jgi:hypothetical protein
MTDQNKKSLRQFQCRDYLWEIFEQMSGELECSVDYLINEAMRQYARSRNYGSRGDSTGASRTATPASAMPAPVGGPGTAPAISSPPAHGFGGPPAPVAGARPRIPSQPAIPSAPPPPPGRGGFQQQGYPAPPAPQPGYGGYAQPQPQAGYPAPPPARSGGYPAPPSQPGYGGGYPAPAPQPGYGSSAGFQQGYPAPPPPSRSSFPPPTPGGRPPGPGAPPPLPSGGAPQGMPGMTGPMLYVIFNGQKYPVNKEEFIIGRGAKTADLPIKDGNISRRHAAIIYQNGAYYMKDLGSTNGVEFQGRRVDGRQIQEGDVYQLCDYELRFTYR